MVATRALGAPCTFTAGEDQYGIACHSTVRRQTRHQCCAHLALRLDLRLDLTHAPDTVSALHSQPIRKPPVHTCLHLHQTTRSRAPYRLSLYRTLAWFAFRSHPIPVPPLRTPILPQCLRNQLRKAPLHHQQPPTDPNASQKGTQFTSSALPLSGPNNPALLLRHPNTQPLPERHRKIHQCQQSESPSPAASCVNTTDASPCPLQGKRQCPEPTGSATRHGGSGTWHQ